ncbi:ABC transporter ATP-binding protein [Gordonia sinesedis]
MSSAAGAEDLTKVYGTGDTVVHALRGVTVEFGAGQFTAIMGPSGSGKSTLMHCLAGLDVASGGRVHIGDVDLTGLSDKQMTMLRRDRIGFVFQSFNLVPTLTAAENITLPVDISGRKIDKEWFDTVVTRLGIGDRLDHLPSELSGGQQQRVACARALVGRPDIIFGDEPTGNLDSRSSGEVLEILRAATDEFGQTVVIVTHDPRAASYADRVIFLADGNIVRELQRPSADDVFEVMKHLDDPPQANSAPAAQPAAGAPGAGAGKVAAWIDPDAAAAATDAHAGAAAGGSGRHAAPDSDGDGDDLTGAGAGPNRVR